MHPATELHNALTVAAGTQLTKGASQSQIEYIVALARGSGMYDVSYGGRLTKQDAGRIIDQMILAGAVADYTITDGEEEDEIEIAKKVEARAAYLKASKSQKKVEKAVREAAVAAAQRKIEGRRVVHKTFGEGTVIEEGANALTIMFDNQPKAVRIAPNFVVNA